MRPTDICERNGSAYLHYRGAANAARRPAEAGRRGRKLSLDLLDVRDGVADRTQFTQILVGNLYAVAILELHGDFHHGQRIDIKVVDKGLLLGDFRGLDTGNLFDYLGEAGDDFFLGACHG